MKLLVLNNNSFPKAKTATSKVVLPSITLSKTGLFVLNAEAAALLQLTASDKIALAQDETDVLNWYIFKDATNGYALRYSSTKGREKTLLLNHKQLYNKFCYIMGIPDTKTHRYLIGGKPTVIEKTEYFGILFTRSK